MDKMRMESVDITDQNIEKIGALFPNVITEAKDENGKLTKSVAEQERTKILIFQQPKKGGMYLLL